MLKYVHETYGAQYMHLTYVLWYVCFTINHAIKKKSIDYLYQAEYFEQFLFWKILYYFIPPPPPHKKNSEISIKSNIHN